jgi:hypothetical protein
MCIRKLKLEAGYCVENKYRAKTVPTQAIFARVKVTEGYDGDTSEVYIQGDSLFANP